MRERQERVPILWIRGEAVILDSDPAAVVYWVKPRDVISKDATEAQQERKQAARADLDLETSMREKGYFWVNGGWVKKGEPVLVCVTVCVTVFVGVGVVVGVKD